MELNELKIKIEKKIRSSKKSKDNQFVDYVSDS